MTSVRDAAFHSTRLDSPVPGVALFIWTLEASAEAALRLDPLLSADERARRDRFLDPRNGARFASGRAELRRLLAAELGIEPGAVRFRYNPHGKPELDQAGAFQFSLSHSDDQAVLAVSRSHVVGVDVEVPRPFAEDVARLVLTDGECATLARLPSEEQHLMFYRYWTCKEAVVKAIGCGLTVPPNRLGIEFQGDHEARVTAIDPAFGPVHAWRLHRLRQVPGCVAALAVRPIAARGYLEPPEGASRESREMPRSADSPCGSERDQTGIPMRTDAGSPLAMD